MMTQIDPSNEIELSEYLKSLESRISALELESRGTTDSIQRMAVENDKLVDNLTLPNTGLLSRSFLYRAFTIWGHYFVAQLIIGLVFFACYLMGMVAILALNHR